ncbi:Serine hydrolase-like protein [Neolecta irregularis DAH-3]|uniref:Serine hydrolase-like protein n=1 Tax=Neolecta irregularis (strain DAH-3) TaxID=1198029 RepID=A0A1U7LVC0_NEOID|nr:Serine hydrolase-like protein [Neolecta irregularis DAH-3]|eukprot:OLL26620.1 Serine hydrolase-like protein [Neolecta irregularis DAH-3]
MNLPLTSLTTAILLYMAYKLLFPRAPRSPLIYLNSLSKEEKKSLPYSLDFFPNGEFIKSPYGYIRAYRFGPLDGKKVLFLHGISTPCPVFRDLANTSVESGFQVLLFDFFGRGYSDAPTDLPFDGRLHISQILAVLAHYQWNKFDIIGYSMGGAIATSFTSFFPTQVQKVILIAPAGLIPRTTIPLFSRIALSPFIPLSLVHSLFPPGQIESIKRSEEGRPFTDRIVETQSTFNPAIGWATLSSLRHSPLFDQEDMFRSLGNREVFVAWGREDTVTPITGLIRMKNLGHDLVLTRSRELCEAISEYLRG